MSRRMRSGSTLSQSCSNSSAHSDNSCASAVAKIARSQTGRTSWTETPNFLPRGRDSAVNIVTQGHASGGCEFHAVGGSQQPIAFDKYTLTMTRLRGVSLESRRGNFSFDLRIHEVRCAQFARQSMKSPAGVCQRIPITAAVAGEFETASPASGFGFNTHCRNVCQSMERTASGVMLK